PSLPRELRATDRPFARDRFEADPRGPFLACAALCRRPRPARSPVRQTIAPTCTLCAAATKLDRTQTRPEPRMFQRILSAFTEPAYALLRIVGGLLFSCHGMQKTFGWFADPQHPMTNLDLQMRIGGYIELVCGLLMALGLFTRGAAFLASGTMAV